MTHYNSGDEGLPRRASFATYNTLKAGSCNSILDQLRRRISPKGGREGPGREQEKNLLPDYGFKTRKDVMKVAAPQGFQVWEKISFFKISVFCIKPGGFFPKLGPDAMVQYLKDLLLEQRKRNKAHGRKKGTLVSRDIVLYRNNSQFVRCLCVQDAIFKSHYKEPEPSSSGDVEWHPEVDDSDEWRKIYR